MKEVKLNILRKIGVMISLNMKAISNEVMCRALVSSSEHGFRKRSC
jgi:hypothetical protein